MNEVFPYRIAGSISNIKFNSFKSAFVFLFLQISLFSSAQQSEAIENTGDSSRKLSHTTTELSPNEMEKKMVTERKLQNNNGLVSTSEDGRSNSQQGASGLVLLNSQSGINTYEIYNDELKYELLTNREKLDWMIALPGVLELGVFSGNLPLRVIIDEHYAETTLKYFF